MLRNDLLGKHSNKRAYHRLQPRIRPPEVCHVMLRNEELQYCRNPWMKVPPLHIRKRFAEAEIANDIKGEEVEPLGQIQGSTFGAVLSKIVEELVDMVADDTLLALYALPGERGR